MSLFFNMLSRLVIVFLPRSKSFNFPGAVNICSDFLLLLSHFSCVRLCVTPQTAAHQAPPSLGFCRQEHWSVLPFPFPMHESGKWKGSRSVMSNSLRPRGLLLHPWDLPGKSTGVGCHHLLHSDFGAPHIKSVTVSTVSPFAMKWWDRMPWSFFYECWALSQLFHFPFTFIKRLFSSSSLFAIRVVSTAYLRLLIFLPAILIPACASSSPVFLVMYSAIS